MQQHLQHISNEEVQQWFDVPISLEVMIACRRLQWLEYVPGCLLSIYNSKMVAKVTKDQTCSGTKSKLNVIRSSIYVESFIRFHK